MTLYRISCDEYMFVIHFILILKVVREENKEPYQLYLAAGMVKDDISNRLLSTEYICDVYNQSYKTLVKEYHKKELLNEHI